MPTKPQLPPPPNQQPSAFANALAGVKSYFGLGAQADVNPISLWMHPVANARITRTPIYQNTGEDWPAGKGGEYSPSSGNMTVRSSELQGRMSNRIVAHESAHDLYERGGLRPQAANMIDTMPPLSPTPLSEITRSPDLYTTSSPKQADEMWTNEGLAYSIGWPSGTPLVNYMASRIKDPALAAQLLRLHQSRMDANFYRDPSTPPLRIVGRKGQAPLVK